MWAINVQYRRCRSITAPQYVLPQQVPQEQQQRQHHRADEDRVFGLELPSKDDADDRPRNRVEAVHDAIIEAPAPAADGGAGVVEVRDDEGKNGAHEEKEDEEDEDEDEEDYPEDKDQEEQKQEGDGSNQVKSTFAPSFFWRATLNVYSTIKTDLR